MFLLLVYLIISEKQQFSSSYKMLALLQFGNFFKYDHFYLVLLASYNFLLFFSHCEGYTKFCPPLFGNVYEWNAKSWMADCLAYRIQYHIILYSLIRLYIIKGMKHVCYSRPWTLTLALLVISFHSISIIYLCPSIETVSHCSQHDRHSGSSKARSSKKHWW